MTDLDAGNEEQPRGRKRWLRQLPTVAAGAVLILALLRLAPAYLAHSPARVDLRTIQWRGLDGTAIPASQFAGKALVVNFWAPWCPPCRIETPWLERLQKRAGGNLLVVGVVADPDEYAHAQRVMRDKGITYLLVQDTEEVRAAFGPVSVLPTSFYVSAAGGVVHTTHGLVPEPLMLLFARQAMHGS